MTAIRTIVDEGQARTGRTRIESAEMTPQAAKGDEENEKEAVLWLVLLLFTLSGQPSASSGLLSDGFTKQPLNLDYGSSCDHTKPHSTVIGHPTKQDQVGREK